MGKDTVCDMMQTFGTFHKRSFGMQLKRLLSETFDISLDEIETFKTSKENHPKLDVHMRVALQNIGQTFRDINQNVWVDLALRNCPENTIFTDVRHTNEMDAILNQHGILILIGRSSHLNNDSHPSEKELYPAIKWFLENTVDNLVIVDSSSLNIPPHLQKFKYFIRNDSTLSVLRNSVDILMHHIRSQNSSK